jgi:hypothetical protein
MKFKNLIDVLVKMGLEYYGTEWNFKIECGGGGGRENVVKISWNFDILTFWHLVLDILPAMISNSRTCSEGGLHLKCQMSKFHDILNFDIFDILAAVDAPRLLEMMLLNVKMSKCHAILTF